LLCILSQNQTIAKNLETLKVRGNYNRIIDARWTSAPDISQHASETEPFIARNTTAYVGVASASFQTLF